MRLRERWHRGPAHPLFHASRQTISTGSNPHASLCDRRLTAVYLRREEFAIDFARLALVGSGHSQPPRSARTLSPVLLLFATNSSINHVCAITTRHTAKSD